MHGDQPVVADVRDGERRSRRGARRTRAAALRRRRRATMLPTESVSISATIADRLADDVEGELLVPGGPVRAEQAVEELRDGHRAGSLWPCADPDRPAHPARRLPAPARRRRGELPARVGRAGPARPPLASSAPARGSSRFEEAETLDEPVVGYLAYDHVAKLEPTVPLPADGPELPESRFVVAETLVRFDHGSGTAEVLAGDADEIAARLERELVFQNTIPPRSARPAADPDQATYEQRRAADPGAHPRRRRVPGRPLAARGAADVRVRARALPGAAPRQPLALPLPARARRARAGRLLARDARQVRGRPSRA